MDSSAQGYLTDLGCYEHYYEELAPITLNYLAALNGFAPRDLSDFDYCELGCGTGLSLLLHGAAYPGGRFVGIDLSTDHIDAARARTNEDGIGNVRLVAGSVADEITDPPLPQFDFIVLHGLYSWVSASVREAIRRFIDARLKPGGLVFVSYNALPGAAVRDAVGDIMRRFAVPLSASSLERTQLGLSYLRLMLNAEVPFFRNNPQAKAYAESLFERDPRYLAHEFFNENRDSFRVQDVAGEMATIGLEFAGCLPLWQNHPEADVPPNLVAFFETQPSRLDREIHKDFIYNTVFRSDVFVRPTADGSHRIGRPAAVADMPFGGVVPPGSIRFDAYSGALELPLASRESRAVFNLIQDAPLSPAQLAAHPALASLGHDRIVELLGYWVLSGQVRPAVEGGAGTIPAEINTAEIRRALRESAQGQVWLASRRFGIAFRLDRLPALALCAKLPPELSPEDGLCAMLAEAGLQMEEDGAALSAHAFGALVGQLLDELAATEAPAQARRQGLA